jgi:glycosyltransferase involved in cell wall biosynthesis
VRVLLDGTPLLGERTGVGRFTARLLDELALRPDVTPAVLGLTARGQAELRRRSPVPVRGHGAPARALRRAWARGTFPPVELLAGRGWDVVHGTNAVLPPSRRTAGVVTVHDLAFWRTPELVGPAERDLRVLVPAALARGAVVCTPTAAVAAQVQEAFGVPTSRCVVTPLGVDPAWFDPPAGPPARLGLPGGYVVFVGADGPRKGLDLLRTALAHPAAPPLVVVGPGARGTGYLPEHELRAVVAGARALVLPSVDEGFGLPALEAQAAGVPVLCSDLPALRESTGGFATFVAREVEAWVAALTELPAADDLAREHARAATWARTAEATVAAYRLALG